MSAVMSAAVSSAADLEHVAAGTGTTFAHRRFGRVGQGVPLVFLQHFRGNLDNWDPRLVDTIAAHRDVVLFDNAGVGSSTGTTPDSVEQMAQDALAFLDAVGIDRADLFGFSLGGFIAQELSLARPDRVRRLVLAGTGPEGAPGMETWPESVTERVTGETIGAEDVLHVFYAPTATSQAAGRAALGRIWERRAGRAEPVTTATRDAQLTAIRAWGARDWQAVSRLADIEHPTLILQGDDDIMVPTAASHTMAGLIPGARLVVFPDASHGSIFQYATAAAAHTIDFLAG